MDPISNFPPPLKSPNSATFIPLAQVYMRNGINVGGFQYRIYQYSPKWHIHLHLMGGVVLLHNVEAKTTFYVPLSNVECSEGFANSPGAPDSAQIPTDTLPRSQSGALIANQTAHNVPNAPVVAKLTALDLGSAEPSPQEKAAKNAHMGHDPKEAVEEAPVSSEMTARDELADKIRDSFAEPIAPVKKKRGRPRKVRPEEAVS